LSVYAADGKPATCSKGHAEQSDCGDCTVGTWGFYADPESPASLFDFFIGNLADWCHSLFHK
jgi:hypothetical protein